ncbi:hypothetical protein BU23DRAFT_600040 [Bimuria novae-zelandiae CBS 107.79]|uniref:Uncharacterized protein n=1 Tax=Bimuria novae-zelandiae CBS 107.79 TaxID=1447943 RepID=A0A6A5V3W5_9PLEO|nr:hypothetical protein BU23DRAFT_600040 [Bimuria novae-zelandiae CBS 107.79]
MMFQDQENQDLVQTSRFLLIDLARVSTVEKRPSAWGKFVFPGSRIVMVVLAWAVGDYVCPKCGAQIIQGEIYSTKQLCQNCSWGRETLPTPHPRAPKAHREVPQHAFHPHTPRTPPLSDPSRRPSTLHSTTQANPLKLAQAHTKGNHDRT